MVCSLRSCEIGLRIILGELMQFVTVLSRSVLLLLRSLMIISSGRWPTVNGTEIRGFHTFRHSFASNLAAKGIDQRVIDEWMGHQTEEMRKRYRHLFPDQQRKAIDSVFGENGK